MSNRSALIYWEMTRHKRSDVAREFDRIAASDLSQRQMLVLIEIDVGKSHIRCVKNDDKKNEIFENHLQSALAGFQAVLGLQLCGAKRGVLLLWLADGAPAALSTAVPVLVFSRNRSDLYSIAIPDPHYLGTFGYSELLGPQATVALENPWEDRKNTAFWRGSDSGYEEQFSRGRFMPRVHLCLTAKDLRDSTLVDAAISRVVHPYLKSQFEQMGILGEYIPAAEFVRYKYLIDIDGYYCPWSSTFHKLSSTSVVLKVESDYEQWYYDRLVPWEHYIPVKHDLSDLEARVAWARAHDQACKQIAARAHKLMVTLSFGRTLIDFGDAVAKILNSQDDD